MAFQLVLDGVLYRLSSHCGELLENLLSLFTQSLNEVQRIAAIKFLLNEKILKLIEVANVVGI